MYVAVDAQVDSAVKDDGHVFPRVCIRFNRREFMDRNRLQKKCMFTTLWSIRTVETQSAVSNWRRYVRSMSLKMSGFFSNVSRRFCAYSFIVFRGTGRRRRSSMVIYLHVSYVQDA